LTSSASPSELPEASEPQKATGAARNKTKELKKNWSLNEVALNKLLDHFSHNRDEAAVQYDLARRKLIRYFEWRSVRAAEACADEALDRVARRIVEGQQIDKLMAYIFTTAHNIHREVLKAEKERGEMALDDAPLVYLRQKEPEIVDPDVRLICFDRCLEELGAEGQNVILRYYEGEGREKIDNRLELAAKLKIPLNALRIRVHRIKRTLEECIAECRDRATAKRIGH
jgi:DNA-directed RNA polymerase specialized sigma24 family protein